MNIKAINESGAAVELPFEKFAGIVPGVGDEILSKADPAAPKCYVVQSRTFCPDIPGIMLHVLTQECTEEKLRYCSDENFEPHEIGKDCIFTTAG